jgi:predicted phosphodiesterase
VFPEKLVWKCEEVNVMMVHIGGYPKRYAPGVKNELVTNEARLFISGHSHILKVIYDDQINCLHMNPGAAGKQGWHKIRTLLRFTIDGADIKDCQVIELAGR